MKIFSILIATLAFILTFLNNPFVQAATYRVDTTIDSADPLYQACTAAANDCNLRGAILLANSVAGADTVLVPAGIYSLTLLGYDNTGLAGDLDITDSLTLRGQGGGVTIDASAVDENVLHVLAGAPSSVALINLVITGGFSAPGAGVYVESGNVLIRDCTIQGNDADSNSGGGIYNLATLTVSRSVIQDNHVVHDGAGIYNALNADLTLVDTTVQNNISDRQGGGMHNLGRSILSRSTFSGNTAASTGGAVDNRGELTLKDSTVDGNTSNAVGPCPAGGGGILNYEVLAVLKLKHSTISNNSAPTGCGGGIASFNDTILNADSNTQITGNTALYTGGLDARGPTVLNKVSVLSNTSTLDAGGITGAGAPLTIVDSTISDNVSGESGGGIKYSGNFLTISGSEISRNSAQTFGGGIYQLDTRAPNGGMVIQNSSILDNFTTGGSGEGGGIFNYTSDLNLSRVTVSGNSATANGGGIKNTDSRLTIYGSTLSGNTAQGDGGGIQNDWDGFLPTSTVSLSNSTISGNTAVGSGGGVYNQEDFGSADIFFFNVTVANNDAMASLSDGIMLAGGSLTSRNSIIGQQVTPGADCMTSLGGVITSPGANLEEGTSCGFALNGVFPALDPLANNGGTTETHALQAGSPGIDAGNPAGCRGDQNGDGVPDVLLSVDQRDAARGMLCDLGAYEF